MMLAIAMLVSALGRPAGAAVAALSDPELAQAPAPADSTVPEPAATDTPDSSGESPSPEPTVKPKYTPPPLLIPLRKHSLATPMPTDAATDMPAETPTDVPEGSEATPKPKYVPPPLPIPLGQGTPAPESTPVPETQPAATDVPTTPAFASTETPFVPATLAPTLAPTAPPTMATTGSPTLAPTEPPDEPTAEPTAPPRAPHEHATVSPSLPTVAPIVEPTMRPLPPKPNPQGAPSANELIDRAVSEARTETQHPYIAYHLHKKLVVSEAFSQDVAYDVVERASDRLTRFQDVTTGVVRIGPPEPRRPDMPPALWGPDARDVNAGIPYNTAATLLNGVHYDARVVGAEPIGTSLAYRVLLEPHDGGLHDVLRSVLIEATTGRVVEVVTRRIVPLRISVAGHVKDIEIPADVTIDYDFVDNASVISHLRLLGIANGRTADFQYDIDQVAFPETVSDDTFRPLAPNSPAALQGVAADKIPPLAHMNGQGVTLIAIGDSLTVGIGTNVCRGGCVTTPTRPGSGTDVPGSVQDFALALRDAGAKLTFVPLGVTGANTGEAPKAEDPGSGDVLANTGQLLQLGGAMDAARARGDRIVVMLWSGSNDVFDAFYATECVAEGGRVVGATTGKLPCASAGTTLTGQLGDVTGGSFYHGYLRVIRAIALSKPDVIVAMNVEDVSRLPKSLVFSESERRRLSHDVDLANEAIADAIRDSAASNAALVDLYAYSNGRPELFSAPYIAVDGLHPSDLGYRAIAAAIAEYAGKTIQGTP